MYTETAELVYKKASGKNIEEVKTEVFVKKVDVYGQEFHLSYQSGLKVQYAFEVNKYDFEETEHTDADTGKVKYASQLLYNGARYDIVRYQGKDDKILLFCS